jgi:hypothetical protein
MVQGLGPEFKPQYCQKKCIQKNTPNLSLQIPEFLEKEDVCVTSPQVQDHNQHPEVSSYPSRDDPLIGNHYSNLQYCRLALSQLELFTNRIITLCVFLSLAFPTQNYLVEIVGL